MASSGNETLKFCFTAGFLLLITATLIIGLLARDTLPTGSHATYSKYGCIPDDSSKREWDQFVGLSTCR
jgi:hypothetical protein